MSTFFLFLLGLFGFPLTAAADVNREEAKDFAKRHIEEFYSEDDLLDKTVPARVDEYEERWIVAYKDQDKEISRRPKGIVLSIDKKTGEIVRLNVE